MSGGLGWPASPAEPEGGAEQGSGLGWPDAGAAVPVHRAEPPSPGATAESPAAAAEPAPSPEPVPTEHAGPDGAQQEPHVGRADAPDRPVVEPLAAPDPVPFQAAAQTDAPPPAPAPAAPPGPAPTDGTPSAPTAAPQAGPAPADTAQPSATGPAQADERPPSPAPRRALGTVAAPPPLQSTGSGSAAAPAGPAARHAPTPAPAPSATAWQTAPAPGAPHAGPTTSVVWTPAPRLTPPQQPATPPAAPPAAPAQPAAPPAGPAETAAPPTARAEPIPPPPPPTSLTPPPPPEPPAPPGPDVHTGAAVSRGTPLTRPASPRVVCVANQKGGVGKTTTAVNMAAALAQEGMRVLLVDCDPQGNASSALGLEREPERANLYDVLIDQVPVREAIRPSPVVPGLSVLASTIDLAGAEVELVPVVAREQRLRKALREVRQEVDYVFLDCPPSLGLITINALVAAQEVLIPIQCEYYALEGLGQLLRNVELVRVNLNEDLAVSAILLTMYDPRVRLADQVADEVRAHFGDRVLDTVVPRSVRVSEAPGYGLPVVAYDPGSRGSVAYREAAVEFARMESRQ